MIAPVDASLFIEEIIRAPMAGWSLIRAHSSSLSGPGFCKIDLGTQIFPMSWSRVAQQIVWISCSEQPSRRAVYLAQGTIRMLWLRVDRSQVVNRLIKEWIESSLI